MWWIILLIPIAILVLLMFLKVRLCLTYDNDFSVKIKVLFFNINLFPRSVKKPNPKKHSIKALQKKQNKLNKKKTKKQSSESSEATTQEALQNNKSAKIKEILELIKIILENVLSPFGRYLKVEIVKMHITVGTDDPAKTAVIYGGICQLTSYIIELLSNLTNVDVKKQNSIFVNPDFLEGKTDAKINITLGLRVWHGLSLALKFFMGYIKRKNQKT